MKLLFPLILTCFIGLTSLGQSLEGEWKGTFETNFYKFTNVSYSSPIKLYFKLNTDSSYDIYSYSKGPNLKGRDTTIVCKVDYKFVGKDSIYLEEIEVIKPQKTSMICLQKMKLKIEERANQIILSGTWTNDNVDCAQFGIISLSKKNKK